MRQFALSLNCYLVTILHEIQKSYLGAMLFMKENILLRGKNGICCSSFRDSGEIVKNIYLVLSHLQIFFRSSLKIVRCIVQPGLVISLNCIIVVSLVSIPNLEL